MISSKRKLFFLSPLIAAALLSGCAPALRQAPPDSRADLPTHWAYQGEGDQGTSTSIAAQWWQALGNAELNRHVEAALARNANLQVAGTRVAAARAQLEAADAALLPSLNLGASAGVTHTLTPVGITT